MKKITTISLAAALLAAPAIGFAVTSATPISATGEQAVNALTGIIDKIGTWALILLGALATIYIIIAAFDFIMAKGDPAEITKARKAITYALVALVIGAVAKLLTSIIGGIASGIQ